MDLIREKYVGGGIESTNGIDEDTSEIILVSAEEFCYTDPVDRSTTKSQGLVLNFRYNSGDDARVVFRLSGTGSSGSTVRMYLEKYEKNMEMYTEAAPSVLKTLAERAIDLVQLQKLTGRVSPTLIT